MWVFHQVEKRVLLVRAEGREVGGERSPKDQRTCCMGREDTTSADGSVFGWI